MTSDSFGTWSGVAIGVVGIAFALYEYRKRTRVESIVKDALRRLAGAMRVVHSNAKWADAHLRNVGFSFAEATPDLNKIRRETFDAARDATACARQLGIVHLQIRGIQQSVFKDIEETLPEIKADDVRAAEQMLPTSWPAPSAPPLSSSNPQSPR